jgi:rhodanese-related sulfurtransferase
MPTSLDRHRTQELVDAGAQLVEVLPRDEYDEEHLPSAISLPLRTLTAESASVLDVRRPVIVYCWDSLCDMSPRAAWRLERLGFEVYDYTAGKADWLAAGLPSERQPGGEARALESADRDPATCQPDETIGVVAARRRPVVVVLNDACVVLGLLTDHELQGDPSATVESAMQPGPRTVRAHEPLAPLLERMAKRNVDVVLVTTPEGTLLGVLRPRGTTHA